MREAGEAFRAAIQSAGLHPPGMIVADGAIHRFASSGRRGDDAGWYALHDDDIPSGIFGDWRSGLSQTWRGDGERRLSSAQRIAVERRVEALRAARVRDEERRHEEARIRAAQLVASMPLAPGHHPYLVRKGVGTHGLLVCGSHLMVPVMADGELRSLQFIGPDGGKRFLRGGYVKGGHFFIGSPREVICICEGYATAASIHEATGHAVAVAFNAGNLLPVAQALRGRFPEHRIIICADDDVNTLGNPGLTKACEAAQSVNGLLGVPAFGMERPKDATDFNDLHRHGGLDAVRAAIDHAQTIDTGLNWSPPGRIVAELRPVPTFNGDVLLPNALRGWIMDEAERMPCPPEFIASAALVAMGSIVGTRCAIMPKQQDSWLIVPNLWGGIVGDPSAKKSPAWSAALKPLDRLTAAAREDHQLASAEFETARVVHQAQKDAIEARIKEAAKKSNKDNLTGLACDLRAHGEQSPRPPTLRRYRTNDCTVEKLGELLRDNPAGLLVLRDELVGLLASWEREGREGDRAFFLEAWNGNQSFDTDRIGRGHISVPNLCVSIFGGIQPDKLTVYLEQATRGLANDGMLQRLQLLVFPDPRRWEWRDRRPDKQAWDAAVAVFDRLATFDPVVWGAAAPDVYCRFPCFAFDEAAQEIFIEWSADLHRNRIPAEDEPIVRQHLAKYDKLFPGLALIFHLVECAVSGRSGPVGRHSALRAAAWCEFLEAHARRCYGLLKDDGLRAAQALATRLTQGALEDGFTLRDVRRNQWRHLTQDAAIQAALDWLEDENWIAGQSTGGTGPGSGRRTVRYSINPAIRANRKEDRP